MVVDGLEDFMLCKDPKELKIMWPWVRLNLSVYSYSQNILNNPFSKEQQNKGGESE